HRRRLNQEKATATTTFPGWPRHTNRGPGKQAALRRRRTIRRLLHRPTHLLQDVWRALQFRAATRPWRAAIRERWLQRGANPFSPAKDRSARECNKSRRAAGPNQSPWSPATERRPVVPVRSLLLRRVARASDEHTCF